MEAASSGRMSGHEWLVTGRGELLECDELCHIATCCVSFIEMLLALLKLRLPAQCAIGAASKLASYC